MTLCPVCATEHRAVIEFAATVIDVELAGRRKSQAAADLRALLPPKPEPRRHPMPEHNTAVIQSLTSSYAVCSCGWAGPDMDSRDDARRTADDHQAAASEREVSADV